MTIADVLRGALAAEDYAILSRLAAGGRWEDLFVYDPRQGRFEPAERRFRPRELEAVLRAADALTARRAQLHLAGVPTVPGRQRVKYEIQYAFGPAELPLYEEFRRLLAREVAPLDDVMIEEGAGLDGPILTVTIAATTDDEYRRARDHLQWLYEVAVRTVKGEPYRGSRPW